MRAHLVALLLLSSLIAVPQTQAIACDTDQPWLEFAICMYQAVDKRADEIEDDPSTAFPYPVRGVVYCVLNPDAQTC